MQVNSVKIRVHVFVSGLVQGVFFRSKTSAEARRQGVTGWVRNLFDGRVEAVFEGEEESVKRLLDFCRTGPAGARISKVDVVRETYTGEFDSLEIKY